jgi:hypothetical protein
MKVQMNNLLNQLLFFPIVSYLFMYCVSEKEKNIGRMLLFSSSFFSRTPQKSWILNQTLSKASIMDSNEKRNRVYVIGQIENRGQFHQPYGAERKCAGCHSLVPFSVTNQITIMPN